MQRITEQLASRVTTVIEYGSKKQWLFACAKNDGFISSIMDTSKVSKARLNKMQDRNLDALSAFQSRKVEGMNLSQRIWKYVDQYKAQMESALDVGLGEGRSADELSRDVRQNLCDPNRLFRRVRDKRGNLVLSKAAKAFHPGQGVYRSSYKNAMRLTRSEINMAYRESDYQRWQQLDFVVGFEIHRSNHEPLCKCDICSKLVGRYPKTFKFKGWHPQCMCYATPILMDEETFDENELGDLKAALHGTEYKHLQAKNVVADVPEGFNEWIDAHKEAQKGWRSTPYFIKDNFKDGQLSKGLNIALPTVKKAIIELFKGSTLQEIKDFIIQNIAKSCTLEIKSSDIDLWNDIVNQLNNRIKQFGLEKFGNIGTPRSRNAQASWDAHGNILNLNITALRNKTAIKTAMSYKKRGILYSFAYEDSDDYVRATIDHELGHLILSKYANVSEVAKLMGDVGKSIMVNGKSFNPINDILGYYASTEEHEFFAEAFSFYMGKNRDRLDDRIKDYFEKMFARHGFKLDGNEQVSIDPLAAIMSQITNARQLATQWGLTIQLKMLEKYVAEKNVSHIQSTIATIQSKVSIISQADKDIRSKCAKWGLSTYVLDQAMNTHDSRQILNAQAELETRCLEAEKEYNGYLSEARKAINDAHTAKIDASDVEGDVNAVSSDLRDWVMGKVNIKQRLSGLMDRLSKMLSGSIPTPPDDVEEDLNVGNVAITAPKAPSVTYVLDDTKKTFEERAKNYFDALGALYGSSENCQSGYKGWWQNIKANYSLYKGVQLKLDKYIIQNVNKYIGGGIGEHLDAIAHLGELAKATDLDKIPMKWRTIFNGYIKKIEGADIAKDGYISMYHEIEGAYNIYRLSTNKDAIAYGLGKISPKMPCQVFDIAKKLGYDVAKNMPKKAFFDSLEEFVPLSINGTRGEGSYFSPVFKFVRIPINNTKTKDRFNASPYYRKSLFYHEFGHARDILSPKGKWNESKEWKDLFAKFKKEIRKDNGVALEAAILKKVNDLGIMSVYKGDQAEMIGKLTDTVQSLVKGHRYIWAIGHPISYWMGNNGLIEFIAHASECYWGGNDLFKELYPELYKEMCKLMKKMK